MHYPLINQSADQYVTEALYFQSSGHLFLKLSFKHHTQPVILVKKKTIPPLKD